MAPNAGSGKKGDFLLTIAPGCTNCGSIGVAASVTPTICKVQGSYVTALNRKGICQLWVSLAFNGKIFLNERRKVFIQVS